MEENNKNKNISKPKNQIVLALHDLYIQTKDFNLLVSNHNKTKLRYLDKSKGIIPISEGKPLLDVLCGIEKINIPEYALTSARRFFRIERQIGFSSPLEYDFANKQDKFSVYSINTLLGLQNDMLQTNEFMNF